MRNWTGMDINFIPHGLILNQAKTEFLMMLHRRMVRDKRNKQGFYEEFNRNASYNS